MPFKAKTAGRHHIPKQKRRVTNWAAYDASLRQRGSLTVWFNEDAIAGWRAEGRIARRATTLLYLGDPDRALSAGGISPGVAPDRGRPATG